jgi:hypothetical protein
VKYLLHPEADEEFAGAIRYYSQISPELGVRFYREMERLFREICIDPKRFRKFDPPARRLFSAIFTTPSFIWKSPIIFGSSRSCT